MTRKLLVLLICTLALVIAVSAVSASENATELTSDDTVGDVLEDGEPIGETPVPEEPKVNKTATKISASKISGYEKFTNKVTGKLTSKNKPLASKKVTITLNGVTYKRTTNSKGMVTLKIQLKKGTYNAVFKYAGDNATKASTGNCKIVIREPTKTALKVGDKNINYRQGSKCLFYVKLVDTKGKPIKNQKVTFKVAGKKYTAKSNKLGMAKIYVKLKKGTHKVRYSFKRNAPYLSSSGSYKIKVKQPMGKGNGYWVWSAHMNSVGLKSIANKGTKQIFLHVNAIALYGKSAVVSFIKRAHGYGMKVHMWMQVCYSGGKWVSPVNPDGSFKYGFLNKKIGEAKGYAKIKGVDGVHFDYIRFGGTAHKHKGAVDVINYFSKKASIQIHKIRPNCIVSAAIMPEPSAMHYYYGQDVPTMSKYMDALIPMVYKGNYHQTTKWIKSVTKTFVGQSRGAQIWTGLQSYYSDDNPNKLPHSEVMKDARSAMAGGAAGVLLFRIGITCNFNFKKV